MDITNDELLQAYKKEKYGKKKERLHAMCIIKINESTIAETANLHLSMIEEIWRQCKHVNVESEFYESIHEMRYTVMEYFRTHKFNLNMYQYFARTIN